MDFNELIAKLREALDIAEELNEQQLNELSMYKNPRSDIRDFQDYVLNIYKDGDKKSYILYKNVKIPVDCILHVEDHHKMSGSTWKELLDNFNPAVDEKIESSRKPQHGKFFMYKFSVGTQWYGYLLNEFDTNKNPIMITAFKGTQDSVDKWIQDNM